jgi:hypothetical protein
VGTSKVIKTEHTMIALLYSPTAMSVFDFGLSRKADASHDTVSGD